MGSMKTRNSAPPCLATLAALTCCASIAHGQVEVFDGVFDLADWTDEAQYSGSGGSYGVDQIPTGGNPDEYRWVGIDVNSGDGTQGVYIIHILDYVYSPSTMGAIDSIGMSMDMQYFSGYGGDTYWGQAMRFVVEQEGKWFLASGGQGYNCDCWQSVNEPALRETDFDVYPSGQPPHPDFSSDAPGFRIGFWCGNSAGGHGGTFGRTQGYDNFHAIFNPQAPTVYDDPVSLLLPVGGGPATMTIAAAGAEPLGYQWRRDGIDLTNGAGISGVDTPTLQIAATESDEGLYDCVVTNAFGSANSASAVLGVRAGCPGDFNDDGTVNTIDVLDFLNAWVSGCP